MQVIENIKKFICSDNISIFSAMKKIESLGNKFLLIAKKDNFLLGTLTDGDIRRGIINGLSLKSPINQCMKKNFITGKLNQDKKNISLFEKVSRVYGFLPILDEKGCVKKVFIHTPASFKLNILIMAGGFGKRLGRLTKNIPKPLLKINGEIILEKILSNIEKTTSFNKLYISAHFLSHKIEKFVNNRKSISAIKVIKESKPLGTAGCIYYIENKKQDHLMVINGDLLINLDFSAIVNFHFENNFDATVVVSRYEVNVPFGVIKFDNNGDFVEIKEKPNMVNYVSSGINILSPKFQKLVKSEKNIDMPELLSLGRSLNLKIGVFPLHEKWIDLGSPEDLKKQDKKKNEK